MKKLSLFIAITFILGFSSTYAAERDGANEFKAGIQKINVEAKEKIQGNISEAKGNRTEFREEYSEEIMTAIAELDADTRTALMELRENFTEEVQEIIEEIRATDDEDEIAEIEDEIESISEEYYDELVDLVGEDSPILEITQARTEVFEANKTLREENRKTREEVKEERKQYISTYKTAFVERIGNRLDNIPTTALETALEKINAKIDELEENEKLSEERKESQMDALLALLEIVEDKIAEIDGE